MNNNREAKRALRWDLQCFIRRITRASSVCFLSLRLPQNQVRPAASRPRFLAAAFLLLLELVPRSPRVCAAAAAGVVTACSDDWAACSVLLPALDGVSASTDLTASAAAAAIIPATASVTAASAMTVSAAAAATASVHYRERSATCVARDIQTARIFLSG